ncbi:MAG: hypothetical protein HQK53_11855 [Oligoflexia bacterium]|nr:hypothetical protein [Oligoflexia bacterium]
MKFRTDGILFLFVIGAFFMARAFAIDTTDFKANFGSAGNTVVNFQTEDNFDFQLDPEVLSSGTIQISDSIISSYEYQSESCYKNLRDLNASFYNVLQGKSYNNIYMLRYAYLLRNTNLDAIGLENIHNEIFRQKTSAGINFGFPEQVCRGQLMQESPDFVYVITQPLPNIIGDMSSKVFSKFFPPNKLTVPQTTAIASATAFFNRMPDKVEVVGISDPRSTLLGGSYGVLGDNEHSVLKGMANFIFYYKINNGRDVLVIYHRLLGLYKPRWVPNMLFTNLLPTSFRNAISDTVKGVRTYFDKGI